MIQTKPCPLPCLAAPGARWMFPTSILATLRLGQGHCPPSPKCSILVFLCMWDRKVDLEPLEPTPGPSASCHGHWDPSPARAVLPLTAHSITGIHQSAVSVKQINSSRRGLLPCFFLPVPIPQDPCAQCSTPRKLFEFLSVYSQHIK